MEFEVGGQWSSGSGGGGSAGCGNHVRTVSLFFQSRGMPGTRRDLWNEYGGKRLDAHLAGATAHGRGAQRRERTKSDRGAPREDAFKTQYFYGGAGRGPHAQSAFSGNISLGKHHGVGVRRMDCSSIPEARVNDGAKLKFRICSLRVADLGGLEVLPGLCLRGLRLHVRHSWPFGLLEMDFRAQQQGAKA